MFLFLLASPVPYLWETSWHGHRVAMAALTGVIVTGVAAWFVLGFVYDPAHAIDHLPLLRIA